MTIIILMLFLVCLTMGNDVIIGGSNIMLSTGVRYAIKSISSGNYLDGRDGELNPLLKDVENPNDDRFVQWTIEKSNRRTNGYVLKSVSSGRYLDGRAHEQDPVLKESDNPADDEFLCFTFEATGFLLHKVYPRVSIRAWRTLNGNNRYLNGREDEINPLVTVGDPTESRYLQWYFVPVNHELKYVVSNFEFGDFNNIETNLIAQQNLAFTAQGTVSVGADAVGVTSTTGYGSSIEESFTFGFSQTVGIGIETEIEAGVPFIAGGSTTISASFEFSASQETSMSRTREFYKEVSFTPEQPGIYNVGIKVYENTDAELPFTSTLKITGKSNAGIKYTGQELQGIIYFSGFNCNIVGVHDDYIEAEIDGELKASFAVSFDVFSNYDGQ